MSDLINLLGTWQIQWIVILLAIDVVLGIIGALGKKEFRLGKVADFMKKPVLGYVFGFAVLTGVAQALPGLTSLVTVAFVLIILALIGSILNNLGKIGVPFPNFLKKE